MRKYIKYIIVLLVIIILDQVSKIWAYSHIQYVPNHHIKIFGKIFKLTYVLNYGIAFGLQFSFKYSKLMITVFRFFISLYLAIRIIIIQKFLDNKSTSFCIWGWSLISGGAIGNSIDSIFYGVYLNNAPSYAPMKWFHGQVIDIIHVDFWSGIVPNWVPVWGGKEICILPIFNIADLSIFMGLLVIIFYSFNASCTLKINDQATNFII